MSDYNQQPGGPPDPQYGGNPPYNPQPDATPEPQYQANQLYYGQPAPDQQYQASQPYYQQPVVAPDQQYQSSQAYYQQPPAQPYTSPQQWPHMKIGNWMITMLLMVIPIVNIILMFMWAFGSNVNPSKKSYFQASLIYAAIGVLFSIILWGALASFIATVFSSYW